MSIMPNNGKVSVFYLLSACKKVMCFRVRRNMGCKKVTSPQEGHCEKRCEIQGGGQEMA